MRRHLRIVFEVGPNDGGPDSGFRLAAADRIEETDRGGQGHTKHERS